MQIKKIFFLLLGFCPALAFGKPLECDVSAPIAILINAETGKVLYEKNAHAKIYPASTTKIATALFALQRGLEVDQKVVASADAVGAVSPQVRRLSGKHYSYRLEFGGTHMGIKAGEELDLRTLLYGLLVSSGNDAANVLAESISGSVPVFIKEMGTFLAEIGCQDTSFHNPHGLPDPRHQTTAHDMAIITRYALQFPLFREIVKTTRCIRPQTNMQPESYLVQTNALLKPGKYFYPHAIGVKTGYIVSSGYNLVAAAKNEDRCLIAAVFYCGDSAQRYRSAVQLFEAAFQEQKKTRTLFSKEHDLLHRNIEGGQTGLIGQLEQDVVVSYYPSEETSYETNIDWEMLSLPIEAGQKIGNMSILDADQRLQARVPIVAMKRVEPTWSYRMGNMISQHQVKKSLGVILACSSLGGAFCFYRKVQRRCK